MKSVSLALTALLAMLFTGASVQAAPVAGWGAYGGIQIKDVRCNTSTCLPFPWELTGTSQIVSGGPNQASALATTNPGDPFYLSTPAGQAATAQAVLGGSGVIATPELRTYAKSEANNVGIFSHAVGAQGYTYSGPAQQINLNLRLTANIFAPANSDTSARADVGVIFANDLPFGINTATYLGEIAVGDFNNPNPIFRETLFSSVGPSTDVLSFTVQDGDEFLVWAALDAKAVGDGAIVNALNTLTMEFRDKDNNPITDSSVLMAEAMAGVSEVPLPAGVWLFLTGIGTILGFSRRRKAQHDG